MKTNPKSIRNEKGQFVKTGFNESLYKKEYHQKNKEMLNKKSSEYYYKNREKLIKQQCEYSKRPDIVSRRRQCSLMTKEGTLRGLNKRTYTGNCEICGYEKKRMSYHHWNDDKPSMGIWVCQACHWFVGGIDKGLLVDKYIQLKQNVEKEYANT